MNLPVVIIAGPTACGKSALALVIAETFSGTVINADSMQVYRDLAILTARPSAIDTARVPHKLYGILDSTRVCSVAYWLALVRSEIAAAHSSGQLPIVVGGTGLYIEALQHGLATVPEISAIIRAKTRALMVAIGPVAFHSKLARRDPVMASRLESLDVQRLQRAWEVLEGTGRSLAEWQQQIRSQQGGSTNNLEHALCFCAILLMPSRSVLQAACNVRFRRMLAAGAVAEVATLLAQNPPLEHPILKALGVSELSKYINGCLALEQVITIAQGATRRYAKRQCTWFRHHHLDNDYTVSDRYSKSHPLTVEILSFVHRFLLTEKI